MRIDPKKETLEPIIYWNSRTAEVSQYEGKVEYFMLFINEPRQILALQSRTQTRFRDFGTVEDWKEHELHKIAGTDLGYQLVTFISVKAPTSISNIYGSGKGKMRKNEGLYHRQKNYGLDDYVDSFVAQMKRP